MRHLLLSALAAGSIFLACNSDTGAPPQYVATTTTSEEFVPIPVDYTAGRLMNARLGRGINLGNSWDSESYTGYASTYKGINVNLNTQKVPKDPYNYNFNDYLDQGWGNPIHDDDFAIIKAAGFNSVRIPVRWHHNSDPVNHVVNPERLAGVVKHVQMAIYAGLAVVIDWHHYSELMIVAGNYDNNPIAYEEEMLHFLSIWHQVALTFNAFPDDMVVFEILNEPSIKSADVVNDIMMRAYQVIRAAAPGKTIMFEAYHLAKFGDITSLKMPPDGNIIFSGHYYEPYTYSHQGLGYDCKGDAAKATTAASDFRNYASLAKQYYPDIDGVHSVPMNMGEFGIAGGEPSRCNPAPTDAGRTEWTKITVDAALQYEMSFHYWAYTNVSGFEAYDYYGNAWYPGFPDVLTK